MIDIRKMAIDDIDEVVDLIETHDDDDSEDAMHDFKNMLTTVVANLSLIRDSIQDSEIIARINDAMQASKEATGLASQLLTYSRGNNESKKEEVDVSALLKDAARICTAGSKTRCDVTIEEGLWLSLINRTQIIQVINNLIIKRTKNVLPSLRDKRRILLKQ